MAKPVNKNWPANANTVLKRIGQCIRKMRQTHQGLTIIKFAKKVGCDKSYVSEVELGKRPLRIPKLLQFCNALGVTLADVILRAELLNQKMTRPEREARRTIYAVLKKRAPKP